MTFESLSESLSVCTGLKPGIEYGIGVTAVKNEMESEPATTNALTGEIISLHRSRKYFLSSFLLLIELQQL